MHLVRAAAGAWFGAGGAGTEPGEPRASAPAITWRGGFHPKYSVPRASCAKVQRVALMPSSVCSTQQESGSRLAPAFFMSAAHQVVPHSGSTW